MAYQPKSYRKFIATAATATLVAGAVAPLASAATADQFQDVADKYKEAVQFLLDKDATQGMSETKFGVNENIKRVDAAVWVANVLELDVDNAPEAGFKDVPARAVKEVNALKEAGITNGKSATEFGANDLITRGELAVWIQKGFELEGKSDVTFTDVADKYKDAVSALVDNNITNGISETQFGTNNNAKRGDFAIFLQRADVAKNPAVAITTVKAENGKVTVTFEKEVEAVKAEDFKLTQAIDGKEATAVKATEAKLSEDKKSATLTVPAVTATDKEQSVVVTAAYKTGKAVTAEAFKVSSTTPKVESAAASNLKQVEIKFNNTVDKVTASELSNYSITQGTSSVNLEKVTVAEDGRSAVVTVAGTLASQKEHKLSINNVKAGDKVLSVKDYAFVPVDTTLPTVSKVEALGNKTVRVAFSEPVKAALTSNFKIDGKVVVGSIQSTDNTVILKLSSALTDGEHTLTSAGVKDYAEFLSLSTETKFNVVEDKVAPTVAKVVSASFEKVVLQFSEPVEQVLAGNVYWLQGTTKKYPDANGVKRLSDDTYEFTFSGTNKLTYTTDLYLNGIKDYSGNEIVKDSKVQVTPVIDQTRPEVLSSELDKDTLKTVKVKFSKPLNEESAKKLANYSIKDKDGKVQYITNNISLQDNNKTVVLTLVNKLADNNEYTLSISGVSDNTTLNNVILPYTTQLSVKDVTGPTLSSVKRLNATTLVIDYNEAMATSGDGNVLDPEKYTFVQAGGTKVVPVDLRISGDSKSVVATFDKNISTLAMDVTVKLVKDVAGNYIAPLEQTVSVPTSSSVTTEIEKVEATGTKTVVVKFNRALQSLNANDFIFEDAANTPAINKIVSATLASDGKSATFTLEKDAKEDAAGLKYKTVAAAEMQSQDVLGGTLVASDTAKAVTDKISATLEKGLNDLPVVVPTGVAGDKITLTFNEVVKAADGAQAFVVVKDVKGEELAVTSAIAAGTDKDLVVTLTQPVVGTVTIEVKENPLFVDLAGNKVAAITPIQVDGLVDQTAPTALATADSFKVTSATTIDIKFNEKLDAASFKADAANGFVATGNNTAGDAPTLTKAVLSADGLTVTLTGTNFEAAKTSIGYTKATGTAAITDLAGVALDNIVATVTK